MNNRFTQKAQQVLRQAKRAAEQMGHTYVGTEHLLLGLLREQDSAAYRFLAAKGVTESRVREAVARMDGVGAPSGSMPEMTPRVKHVLESARTEAAKTPSGYIGSEHLLLAILTEEDAMAARVLQGLGCSLPEMASELTVSLEPPPLRKAAPQEKSNPLVSYSRDLTALARAGKLDPVIGREKETDRMIRILTRKQ